jgi:hypothetical protein
LPPTRRTRALALKKLRRICQAEVRRIFFSAKFSLPKKKLPFPALIFEGQLKTRQAPGTSFEPYPIPVLAEPKKIPLFSSGRTGEPPKTFAIRTGVRNGSCSCRIGLRGNNDCGRSDRGYDTDDAHR